MKRFILAAGVGIALTGPAYSMSPQSSAAIVEAAQLVFYRNTGEHDWIFNGYLDASGDPSDPNIVNGFIYPNKQGLFKIPGLSLPACLGYTLNSYRQMIGLMFNGGLPYGPSQLHGGCSNPSDLPPPSVGTPQSCSTPKNGGNHFSYTHVNPIQASVLKQGLGTTCTSCVQGPDWQPCQAGLIGCANPPVPGSCTVFHF